MTNATEGHFFRSRPHLYAWIVHYGVGCAALWHRVEDVTQGQYAVNSNSLFPWRQYIAWGSFYWVLAGLELFLLILFLLRIRLTAVSLALSAVVFLDNLGCFLNHRLFLSIVFFLLSLRPIPDRTSTVALSDHGDYWNFDLIRFQIGLVYFTTALHKLNPQFLSGETLQSIFWMTNSQGMKVYPEWLFGWLQEPKVCHALAWATVILEFGLSIGLQFRRTARVCVPLAVAMHLAMAFLMAYIKIFTTIMIILLVVFLPERRTSENPAGLDQDSQKA